MKRLTAPFAAWVCVAFARALSAQSDTALSPPSSHNVSASRASELTVFAGVSQSARLEATVSPRTFSGPGVFGAVDFRRPLGDGDWTLGASVGGGYRRFTPMD